jgi:TolB-like protein/thioredoxin-like negative regulator of GroEL
MSLFRELKRRNVFRVAAAYVAFAWLVIQVVEVLFPVFEISDAAIRIVVILLAIGFVPAVISAWAFELTPEGFKREAEVDHDSPASQRMTRRLDRLFIVALALALGLFAFDKFVLDPARDKAKLDEAIAEAKQQARVEAREEVRDASVAVLAFQDLSPGSDQAYFAEGLAVDLINQLGNVPALRVTGRTSAFSFKGKDATIPEIGEALNVAHVLDGTVSKAGERVRISVQLTDTRTDTNLWSETFDRTLGDIFDTRDEIALTVFDRLTIEFEQIEQASLRTDPQVYDLTLQARHLMDSWGNSDDADRQASELLDRALAIDPDYVPALLLSAYASYSLLRLGLISDEEQDRHAASMIERVLAIDPENGTALAGLAWGAWETRFDLESAASQFSDALRTAPGDLELTRTAGVFARSIGRHAESIALLERCVAADPRNSKCHFHLAQSYLWGSRFEEAVRAHRRTQLVAGDKGNTYYVALSLLLLGNPDGALKELESFPEDRRDHPQALAARAMIMHDLGRQEASAAALERIAEQIEDRFRDQAYLVAEAYAWTGQIDSAFESLEKAYARDERYGLRGYWFHRIMFLPVWRNLHDDPRWGALRARMNMSAARLGAIEFSLPEWIRVSPAGPDNH